MIDGDHLSVINQVDVPGMVVTSNSPGWLSDQFANL